MALTTACRYFSCSRLLESAWIWPEKGEAGAGAGAAGGGDWTSRVGRQAEQRRSTWRRCILGLEETDDTLAMQAPRAQQHSLGASTAPADHREAVLAVAAGNTLQGIVLDALGNNQQSRIAAGVGGVRRAALRPCPVPVHRVGKKSRQGEHSGTNPWLPESEGQRHLVLIWVPPPNPQDPRLGPMASREGVQALPTTLVSPGKIFLACPGQPSPATYGIHAINRRDAKGLRLGPAQAAAQGT